jgi:hypothetical protein
MAVQGVVSLASGKANNVALVALHLLRKACRDLGTAGNGAADPDQEEFE